MPREANIPNHILREETEKGHVSTVMEFLPQFLSRGSVFQFSIILHV